jgi:transcriptional regulator with XRE-family HTH domain
MPETYAYLNLSPAEFSVKLIFQWGFVALPASLADDHSMEEEAVRLAVPTSVRERRKARGWTQPQLAEMAGISTTAVHNLEAGKNGFTDKTLASLAAAFGCRPADLLLPLDEKPSEISSEPEILAFLARIKNFTDSDVDAAFGVIKLALRAKRVGSQPSEDHDQPVPSNRRHESTPSQ